MTRFSLKEKGGWINEMYNVVSQPFYFEGSDRFTEPATSNIPATSGTVMISGLSIIVGQQLLLSFLNYDIGNVPKETLHTKLKDL